MRDLNNITSYKCSQNVLSYFNQENCLSHGIENVSIIIVNKKRLKNHKKHNVFIQAQQPRDASRLSRFSKSQKQSSITKTSSMPELNKCTRPVQPRNRNSHGKDTKQNKNKQSPFQSNFIVNVVSEHRFDECLNPFNYPRRTNFKIFRCQLGPGEDNCCCSCNSDAMFEVMKSLYDCYKKKNCENCDCILCGHLQPEKKMLSEKNKSLVSITEQEKLLREQAMKGLSLPEGKTASEKKLISKVRTDLGVPIEPKTKAIRDKHEKAAQDGKLLPLEGKTAAEKEKILKDLYNVGIPLPVGRTPSEKALIAKIMGEIPTLVPSEKIRRAKAKGLLTTLKDKTPKQREKILKGLANQGIPLPEGQSPSEKKLIDKVRADLGLPIEPKTKAMRDKHTKAANAGLLQPLEGKTPAKKEKILKGLHDMGISLPKGRTPSEKSLIAKVAASSRHPSKLASAVVAPWEQMRRAKAEGLLTPLKGKSPEKKEKILKALAMKGLPLPESQSPSEKILIDKVRADLGLPKEPKSESIRDKHEQAAKAGLLQPLEGKTPAEKEKTLKGLHDSGIPLPEGRTPSEKALIAKIASTSRHPSKTALVVLAPSEKIRKAKVEGLLTTLKDKTPKQREKILKGLANQGLPLPEGQSPSEKKLIDMIRTDLGLPIEPKTKAMRDKHAEAANAGLLQPMEGKTSAEQEKILKGLHDMGIPLPKGRTPSEKSLIAKVAASSRHPSKLASVDVAPSEQMRGGKAEGLLTTLKDKTPKQREKILKGLANQGLPLPEGQSPSQKKLIDKVRADLGLPKEPKTKSIRDKHEQAAKAGLLQPLEGKTPAEKEKTLKGLHDLGIPLPEGRTPSEKALIAKIAAISRHPSKMAVAVLAPSEKIRRVIAEGLLTPLKGKTPEQREKILKALAVTGLPLPEGQSPSEKKLIDKIRANLGLPIEPKTIAMRDKHAEAANAGLLQPLEGKTPTEKENILKGLHDMGIPLPKGRTPSEKSLIHKIAASSRHPSRLASAVVTPSEQMRRAKAEGLLTPLKGKSPEKKKKILKALAMKGLPLPESQSPSEKKLIHKVRAELGLPREPKSKSIRDKHEQAAKAGLLQPLEGKTPAEKEKTLKGLYDLGIPLPEGRTPSEKALIAKVKALSRAVSAILAPSELMRRAKADGLLTTLSDKIPEQRENILKALANRGIPLPEAQTPSEKKLINKVRADLGLPIEPKNKAIRDKHKQAALAGLLQPLEGKTPRQKEKLLRGQHNMGIQLPVGRTPSEKSLIAKIAAGSRHPSKMASAFLVPSEQMRRAKAEGLLTPLKGKTPEKKEKILKALAMKGLPLPEGQSPSEKTLIHKVRADLGLPKEPKSKSIRDKHENAAKAGLLQPLEGKTPAEKEKTLKGLYDLGIPLPEGRTPSEKALIAKVKVLSRAVSAILAPSELMRRAIAEGLLTTLKDKTPEQREKILRAIANRGISLTEGQTPSEKKLINKVRADLGLPIEPKNKAIRDKHEQAALAGLLQPLEGKTPTQKEKLLQGQHNMGIPLPVGRTPSEKALIAKIAASSRHVSKVASMALSEKIHKSKAEGLLTPLKGKTPEQKEKILKALASTGLPLPEGQSLSDNKLIDKVRADLGLPIEPKTKSVRDKHEQAAKAGLLQPLESKTPAEKEKLLKGLHNMGIQLPVGRTPSEKSLIAKIAASSRHPSWVPAPFLEPSEQMRIAKAEGLLTPLKGKSPEQKEKILKALANRSLPLPEGQSPSEKKLIDKVRADLGLPIEPKSKSIRDNHEQAAKAGLLQPLEGKTSAEKEKLLRGQRNMGIPLPVGRTPSEKALIAKIKSTSRAASAVLTPYQKMRRAKAEGLLTTLKDKTPEQREKILRALANRGIPLPEGQSPSEKIIINKVRADLGLPIEPKTKAIRDKHAQAGNAGLLQPLEGKTLTEKEKILKGLHDMGIPLPKGRTLSEKSLIDKIAASSRHPSKVALAPIAHLKKMRKAKVEGVLTPLKGKSPEQKEKILKALAVTGLPLPEGQSPSEKKLIDRVRADLGLPLEPKTKSIRDKHEQAAKAGLLQPLESKTPGEKEKILKGLHDMGIPLPKGRTPSEKSLIDKIAASSRHPSKMGLAAVAPTEQMRRAKAEGSLTPLKDKTPEEREKILKALANRGIPLPEGHSPSEKKLIDKVRADLGLPIEPKTKAIREKHEQAAIFGKLLPLEGKTPAEKEKILQELHDMGIPLPVGRTASEKSLIAKIIAGLKGKSVGMSASKRLAVRNEAGIATEYESVLKTTKCDRGCGCDKKKIRFKHSYVKIRVTSPDISSFCDCPDECIPGVKSGALIDSEGIKVIVGRAIGIPSFKREFLSKSDNSNTHTEHKGLKDSTYTKYKVSRFESDPYSDGLNYCLNDSSSIESSSTRPNSTESENIYLQSSTPPYEGRISESDRTVESLRHQQPLNDYYKGLNSKTKSAASSLDSILVIKSEMSLCSSSSSKCMDIVSVMPSMQSSITSTRYSGYQSIDDPSSSSLNEPTTSDDLIDHPATIRKRKILRNIGGPIPHHEYTILRMSQTKLNFGNNNMRTNKLNSETEEPIVLFNQLQSKLDVWKIMDKMMSKKRFLDASTIFIVVPMSDDDEEQGSSNCVNSITSIHSMETGIILNDTNQEEQSYMNMEVSSINKTVNKFVAVEDGLIRTPDWALRTSSFTKRDQQVCGKGKKFYMQELSSSSNDTETMFQNESLEVLRRIGMTKNEFCQISKQNEITRLLEKAVQGVGSDTTADRPSYCWQKQYPTPFVIQNCNSNDRYAANVISRQKTPRLLQDKITLPDMRTPSLVSSLQGFSLFPGKTSGSCPLPDLRTPSTVSSSMRQTYVPHTYVLTYRSRQYLQICHYIPGK